MSTQVNYKDILLQPRKCVLEHRKDADITVKLGKFTFASPVIPANMPAIMNKERCVLFATHDWFYVYPRLGGTIDVGMFVLSMQDSDRVVSISVGITEEWKDVIVKMASMKYEINYITIDVAHSHSDKCEEMIKHIQRFYPDAYLIVGNGCTMEWVEWLKSLGVNAAKVGIGVSTACRTRQYTGFGSSTYSDLFFCAREQQEGTPKKLGIDIISDGGLTIDENGDVWIGDIAKAICAGADMVMSGSLFKDCIDSPSLLGGYYGNASRTAKGEHHVEGAHLEVKTTGLTTLQTMKLISDSLKSSVSYAGGKCLADIRECHIKILT